MLQYDNLRVLLNDSQEFDKKNPPKSITITFGLSASAKKINNRIYTPIGQQNGLKSWVKPYAKPILVFHDQERDSIGRIIDVEFVDNSEEAIKFFKSTADFIRFRNEILSDDPKRIYKAMVDSELLDNEEWPGLSSLRAKARITDSAAIEKFIDQRYLNFSGGADTDRWVCPACMSDWHKGDVCEHRPGQVTEDGVKVVFVTGAYKGREISVVNNPAYKGGFVHSIEMSDSISDQDSFILKTLDTVCTVETGVDIREEIIALIDSQADKYNSQLTLIEDNLVKRISDAIAELNKPAEVTEAAAETSKDFVTDETIDLYVLDLALKAKVSSPLDKVALDALDVKVFCAQDRLFPIANIAYTKAARELVNESRMKDSQKQELLSLIDSKSRLFVDESVDKVEYENLKKDYQESLIVADQLREELKNLKETLDSRPPKNDNTLNTIDNPSIASGRTISPVVDDFEKGIIEKYRQILDKQGQKNAESYLISQKYRGYLSKKFDINKFIKENE